MEDQAALYYLADGFVEAIRLRERGCACISGPKDNRRIQIHLTNFSTMLSVFEEVLQRKKLYATGAKRQSAPHVYTLELAVRRQDRSTAGELILKYNRIRNTIQISFGTKNPQSG